MPDPASQDPHPDTPPALRHRITTPAILLVLILLAYLGGYAFIRAHCSRGIVAGPPGGPTISVLPRWDGLRRGSVLDTIYQPLFRLEYHLFRRSFMRL